MNPQQFANILRPLPYYFNISRFINDFDKYIVYLSKDQLHAYTRFVEKQHSWNEFYNNLFPVSCSQGSRHPHQSAQRQRHQLRGKSQQPFFSFAKSRASYLRRHWPLKN